MRTVYIADDGRQFDNEWDCEEYEAILAHPNLKNVTWVLEDGNVCGSSKCMEDFVYNHCVRITVPTDEAAADVRWLANFCGFCDYADIAGMGTWEWFTEDYNSGFRKVC